MSSAFNPDQKAIDEGNDNIEITVNGDVSKENVIRLANKLKMKIIIEDKDGNICVEILK